MMSIILSAGALVSLLALAFGLFAVLGILCVWVHGNCKNWLLTGPAVLLSMWFYFAAIGTYAIFISRLVRGA